MSKWNRPMRGYRSAQCMCYACNARITGEGRMIGQDLYHVLCVPQPKPSPERKRVP